MSGKHDHPGEFEEWCHECHYDWGYETALADVRREIDAGAGIATTHLLGMQWLAKSDLLARLDQLDSWIGYGDE